MTGRAKQDKPGRDQKAYLGVQFVSNLIGAAVVAAFLAWIVFSVFGPGSGNLIEVRAFLLLFLLCFVPIQCHSAVINTRKDYLRGKWMMVNPAGREPDGIINPWRRIGPAALPAAVVLSLAAWFLLPLTGDESFTLFTIDAIAFVSLFLVTTVLIGVILPRDQVSFARALDGNGSGAVDPAPPRAYFLLEHLLPWAVIQGLINMGIGLKQFKWALEGTEPVAAITSPLVAWDFGIVFGILYFFMLLASGVQVRGDVRLGRLAPKRFGIAVLDRMGVPASAVGVILTTILAMIAVGWIMQAVFPLAGLDEFSVPTAVAFKTLAALLGTLAGCGAGVWWGRRSESALMEA